VYAVSFPDLKDRVKVSVGGGGQPRWSPDDKTLYYRSSNNSALAVDVTTKPSLAVSSPRPQFGYVFQPGYSNAPDRHQWAVAPDGKQFLARAPAAGATGPLATAPVTFTSPGGTAPAGGRQMFAANRGLTVLLNWPALVARATKPTSGERR